MDFSNLYIKHRAITLNIQIHFMTCAINNIYQFYQAADDSCQLCTIDRIISIIGVARFSG